jgi:hypothetical protein
MFMTGLRIFCLSLFAVVSPSAAATKPDDVCWMTLGTAGGPPIHADQAQISNAVRVGALLVGVHVFSLAHRR